MEKNTTNYKFLNAKDRASERKNSHGILDTDRYHYKTAPHVQIGKRKRDNDGFSHRMRCSVRTVAPGCCVRFWGNACP